MSSLLSNMLAEALDFKMPSSPYELLKQLNTYDIPGEIGKYVNNYFNYYVAHKLWTVKIMPSVKEAVDILFQFRKDAYDDELKYLKLYNLGNFDEVSKMCDAAIKLNLSVVKYCTETYPYAMEKLSSICKRVKDKSGLSTAKITAWKFWEKLQADKDLKPWSIRIMFKSPEAFHEFVDACAELGIKCNHIDNMLLLEVTLI